MTLTEIILRLGMAALIGAAIGIDREIHHKAAGVRTIAIVALGVALATIVAMQSAGDTGAVSRVIQGALAGIGFLGAGVIVHRSTEHSIEGLTTAASIWTAAALGAACGLGLWPAVIVAAILMVVLLIAGGWVERRLRR